MKNLNTFLKNYNKKFFEISQINDDILIKIKKLYELILKIKKIKKNHNCRKWWQRSYSKSF